MVHQLGPDIPTYVIESEGDSTWIVHHNRLFLLFSVGDSDNCVPLGAVGGKEPDTSPVCTLDNAPMAAVPAPEGCMETVNCKCVFGLKVAQTQASTGLSVQGIDGLTVEHVS